MDGSEPVSALPPIVTGPPKDLVQSTRPPVVAPVARGPRDSLDDGWDALSPAAAGVVVPPVRTAEALPAIRLPWEILTEDSLASEGETVPLATIPIDPSRLAPMAPPEGETSSAGATPADATIVSAEADAGEWATVPDESLRDDAPGEPFEPLQDAVSGDSSPLNTPPERPPIIGAPWVARPAEPAPLPASAAAAVPADSGLASSSVSPVVQNANFYGATPPPKSLLARVAPFVGGAVGLALAGWLVFGDFGKKPAHSSTAVGAARPAAASPAAAHAEKPKETQPAAPTPAAAPAASAAQTEPATDAPGAEKSTFNNKAANVALARALARARSCKKAGDPAGTALAIVTFANNGRVVATNVSGVKITGTPMATCIGNTLKSARVPAFTGEAVTMKKTMKLK